MGWLNNNWANRRPINATSADALNGMLVRVGVVNGTTDAWGASRTTFSNELVTAGGLIYQATAGGITGSSEPTWPTTHNATVTDGTVTWKCRTDLIVAPGIKSDFSDLRFTAADGETPLKHFSLGEWWDDGITINRINASLSTVTYCPNGDIIGSTNNSVVKSTDGGANWTTLITFSGAVAQVRGLLRHSSGRIFASPYQPSAPGIASAGLYLSDANGENWTQITSGAFATYPIPAKSNCWSITEDTAGNVYTADYGPYNSTVVRKGTWDSGAGTFTWSILGRWRTSAAAADATNDKAVVTSSVDVCHCHFIAPDPYQSDKLYLGLGDGLTAGQNNWTSPDGSTWTAMPTGFGQYTQVVFTPTSRLFYPDGGGDHTTFNDTTLIGRTTDGPNITGYGFDGRYISSDDKVVGAYFAGIELSHDRGRTGNTLCQLDTSTTNYHGIRQMSDVRSGIFYAALSTGATGTDFPLDVAIRVTLAGIRYFWINAGDITAGGTNQLYCYWGNSAATEAMDITGFPVGDHFTGSAIDTAVWDIKESTAHPTADDDIVATVADSKLRWSISTATSLGYVVSRHIKSKTTYTTAHHVYFLPTALNQAGSSANVSAYVGIGGKENTDGWAAEFATQNFPGVAGTVYNATYNANYTNSSIAAPRNTVHLTPGFPHRLMFTPGGSNQIVTYPGETIGNTVTTNLPDGTPPWGIIFGINHGGATTTGDGVYLELDYLFAVPVYANVPVMEMLETEESGIRSIWCKVAGSLKQAQALWIKTGGNLHEAVSISGKVSGSIKSIV